MRTDDSMEHTTDRVGPAAVAKGVDYLLIFKQFETSIVGVVHGWLAVLMVLAARSVDETL